MTGHTVIQFKVISVIIMAIAAEWNNFEICRRMTLVTLSAERLMCIAFSSDCENNLFMALTAVAHINCGVNIIFVLFYFCLKVFDENTKQTEANKTNGKTKNVSHNWPLV